MNNSLLEKKEKSGVILVAVDDGTTPDFEYMLDEMRALIEACDMEVLASVVQNLSNPNPGTYLGKGKIEELKSLAQMLDADKAVVADNLSPAQLKNLTDMADVSVLDRTGLILEIFAKRAKTREARLQVESANLHYMLPRLVGMRASLGRQGGASGSMSNKGQGEKQIELDRRHIERKITEVNRELEHIEHDRAVQRSLREKNNIPCVALVGYTNAGKSTLMNTLLAKTSADAEKLVFEKDMLFATLDTTVRKIEIEDNKNFLLSDTVGFVSNLPHNLVKAFRTTLDEVRYADLLLIVLDASDKNAPIQREVTEDTLKKLDCGDIPRIYVMNKCDRLDFVPSGSPGDETRVYISAKSGAGLEELLDKIKEVVYAGNKVIEVLIPYSKGALVDLINREGHVIEMEYKPEGTFIKADVPEWLVGKILG